MIEWKKEYETGVPLVDSQHQALFEQINKLEILSESPHSTDAEVRMLVNFLANYTKNHFSFEESCMHRFNCPSHEQNKAAHAKFIQVVKEFQDKIASQGVQPSMLKQLHEVASNWIKSHILKIDVQLKDVCPGAKKKD